MSESKHTPGPWRVRRKNTLYDFTIADVDDNWKVTANGPSEPGNARLIAAAPELWEAAIDFVNKVETGRARSKDSYAKFKAAIAKAEPPE